MIEIDVQIDAAAFYAFTKGLSSVKTQKTMLAGIAANARNMWLRIAGEKLNTSRRDYVNGIQAVQISGSKALIALVGAFPNMIEHGSLGFDMRNTMLRSKGLLSRVVPFRHRGPATGGHTGTGAPMGSAYGAQLGEKAARKLGKEIYAAAKQLQPGESLPAGMAPRLTPQAPRQDVVHATDIYAGMQKFGSSKIGGNRYMTFRTISENSPPETWIYPPLAPRNLAQQVADELPAVAEQIVAAYLQGLGGKTP